MPDIRDKLLKLDREGLEEEAKKLGLTVSSTMSRAEIITLIEQQYALKEFGDFRVYGERRYLIIGLFFVTIATFILALDTLFRLTSGIWTAFDFVLIPIYLIFRGLGGFLIAAALFSLGLKSSYRSVTPIMRAAFIIGAVLVLIIVIVWLPLPNQWS